MKKIFRSSLFWGFIVGLIIGSILTKILLSLPNIPTEVRTWDFTKDLIEILGSISTFCAVFVALFKDKILKWLYSPLFEIELENDGLSEEFIDPNQRVLVASKYNCIAKITNNGSVDSYGCKFNIAKISYGNSKDRVSPVKIQKKPLSNRTPDIPKEMYTNITLFSINNPNSYGTPQGSNTQPSTIEFSGCTISNPKTKGYWEAEYYMTSKNGKTFKFKLEVFWDGVFSSRATEMSDHLTIKIEET